MIRVAQATLGAGESPPGTNAGPYVERVLKRVKGIAFTRFSSADVVRHPLVARIVDAYDAQGSAAMRAGVTTRRKPLPTDD